MQYHSGGPLEVGSGGANRRRLVIGFTLGIAVAVGLIIAVIVFTVQQVSDMGSSAGKLVARTRAPGGSGAPVVAQGRGRRVAGWQDTPVCSVAMMNQRASAFIAALGRGALSEAYGQMHPLYRRAVSRRHFEHVVTRNPYLRESLGIRVHSLTGSADSVIGKGTLNTAHGALKVRVALTGYGGRYHMWGLRLAGMSALPSLADSAPKAKPAERGPSR